MDKAIKSALQDIFGEGVVRIALERKRQTEQEGYSEQHDAAHDFDELANAAASYAMPPTDRIMDPVDKCPITWPWNPEDWKPSSDRIRELEKAGALIAAEIDRILSSGNSES